MGRVLSYFRSGRGLFTFATVTLAWMVLVILEGAVVRATGSGAGCGNHWPLCNGEVIPHHPRLATIIEFAHRSLTGVCSALTLGLVAWTFAARPKGSRVRKAAIWALVLLFTEALLGAVLVKGGYVEHNTSPARVVVQGVHFTNTMLLLGALSLCWWWQRVSTDTPHVGARSLSFVAIGAVLLTGASGSVAALADTLFPSPNLHMAMAADFASSSPLLVRMRWMHPAMSVIALFAIVALAAGMGGRRRSVLLGLLMLQFAVGVADVLWLAPVTLQVLHLLAADLLWIALVASSAETIFTGRALEDSARLIARQNVELVTHHV